MSTCFFSQISEKSKHLQNLSFLLWCWGCGSGWECSPSMLWHPESLAQPCSNEGIKSHNINKNTCSLMSMVKEERKKWNGYVLISTILKSKKKAVRRINSLKKKSHTREYWRMWPSGRMNILDREIYVVVCLLLLLGGLSSSSQINIWRFVSSQIF